MRVTEGATWVASCTENFDETMAFFRDVMGLEVARQGTPVNDTQFARFAVIKLPNDTMFELFEPTEAARDRFGGPVISFTVDDLNEARREMEAKGIEFVSELIDDGSTWRWIYFRAPDGNIYLLQERH